MPGDEDTKHVQVKTRVPQHQKEQWERHADRLNMTQSEFVRTMVQAGRRGFEGDPPADSRDGGEAGGDPWGNGLETRLQTVLREEGTVSWDRLVERLIGDVEKRVDRALEGLQSADRVRYSIREGGYALADDEE